jgi:hypothetical protein
VSSDISMGRVDVFFDGLKVVSFSKYVIRSGSTLGDVNFSIFICVKKKFSCQKYFIFYHLIALSY